MIYLVTHIIAPNTATTNRYLSLARSIKSLGVDFENVVVTPDKSFAKIDEQTYGKTHYLWIASKTGSKFFDLFIYAFWRIIGKTELLFKFFSYLLLRNDIVIITTPHELSSAVRNNFCGYKIYHERTEHPLVSRSWASDLQLQKYLRDCTKVDGLFVISSVLKQTFINLGVPADRTYIVNMTVDPFRFQGLEKQNCEPYIAYCGTVSNAKDGVDCLIKSFSIVAQQNKQIKLYVIGSIPNPNERNSNLELIKELRLENQIVFTGVVPAEGMPQILKNAKVLVLARPNNLQAKNGFPTKLGEYLLTGNPVVITKTGDIPLFLKDGFSALLCEPDNCKEIANKIIWAINNYEEAMIIGKQGREVALAHFNCKTEAEKILKVIRNDE